MPDRLSVGEVLIDLLERQGVDMVFGIPGVHTVELYRGLAASSIRHVTPRHELSAGFMADGYARLSGKPGVCLLITGPGLTNAITAMAQARADSIPMLVISGVNKSVHHGHEDGYLHELPDQVGLMRSVALFSHCLQNGADLQRVLHRAFAAMTAGRPGPVHIEIPLDVMSQMIDVPPSRDFRAPTRSADPQDLIALATRCKAANQPVILAGGGAVNAELPIRSLAERLGAPVVTTTNARGIMSGHDLHIPASPSLPAVRSLLAAADLVIAAGAQLGPTDMDLYVDGAVPDLGHLVRIDIDPLQATRGVLPDTTIISDVGNALERLLPHLEEHRPRADGAQQAKSTRNAAFEALSQPYQEGAQLIKDIQNAIPGCVMVGDSTQLVYAGNCYAEIDRPRGWFNASVGYGALGYGAPAAIGAQLAAPSTPVVCITGDGGFQFCLSELGTAMDEATPVVFLVWNNSGYREIENFMKANDIATIGVTPSAPDFVAVAAAYGMAGEKVTKTSDVPGALARAYATGQPYLVELIAP